MDGHQIPPFEAYRAGDELIVSRRTIDGVTYRLAYGEGSNPRLDVTVGLHRQWDRVEMPELPHQPSMSTREFHRLRYRVTTDGWATYLELRPAMISPSSVQFSLPIQGNGWVEGVFHVDESQWLKNHGDRNFDGYEVRLPSRSELQTLRRRA